MLEFMVGLLTIATILVIYVILSRLYHGVRRDPSLLYGVVGFVGFVLFAYYLGKFIITFFGIKGE